MKNFYKKTAVFLLIPCCLYIPFNLLVLPTLLEFKMGPNVEEQLQHSFSKAATRKYDMVILGNSRMFCGVNPDQFSISTFNFSHNNDSYNQLYYKLMWLEKKQKKVINVILGVDYFQFGIFADTRNYVYSNYLGKEYDKDYPQKNYKLSYYKDLIKPEKIRALIDDDNEKHGLKENGQYVRLGTPKNEEFIKRDYKRKSIQEQYFEKIIQYCQTKNIKVFLVMPPLREAELKNYTPKELLAFDIFLKKYIDNNDVYYFNFSRDENFKWNDFIDFTHLNQQAADKFSNQLNDSINKQLNKTNN